MEPSEVLRSFLEEAKGIQSPEDVQALRVKFLGKKGAVKQLMSRIKQIPPDQRKAYGQEINKIKRAIEQELENALDSLSHKSISVDLTRPGRPVHIGNIHPITRVFNEIIEVFVGMGFSVETGPEVEWDELNFEALNIPKHHPARDIQDTMYITEDMVLRTHTSPVQIRAMRKRKNPPIRILAPGKVYRSDAFDATHSPCFHQLEGLYIDENVSFAGLKSDLLVFAKAVFGSDTEIRFVPSYFPFTEPSAEVAVKWKGQWLELLGCGMVHPDVLRNGGIDPDKYSGYAFGFGIERIAMVKFGIDDIRHFYENDVAFLDQIR